MSGGCIASQKVETELLTANPVASTIYPMSNTKLANTLKDVFNTANPIPLQSGDSRYVDCSAVRGNEDVVNQLYRRITWSNQSTVQLFTGHRGCGKSTELLRLKHQLEEADFAVIYFEADDVISMEDLIYSDVLVAIARQVFQGLEAMEVDLGEDLLDDVFEWFAEEVLEYESTDKAEAALETEFGFGTPELLSPLARIMAKVTGQLRTGVESRRQVRQRLDPQISQLILRINLLLSKGASELRKQNKQGLAVIVDNLDRIQFRTLPDGRNSHDALYLEHGEQLCSLDCHLVYTVPIAMFYSPNSAELTGIFADHNIVPMIKIEERNGTPYAQGLEILQTILAERIDLDAIFENEALDLLCRMGGGHPRLLMTLVRDACGYAQNRFPKPIDRNAVERAVINLTRQYSRAIPEEHFPLLAQVAQTKEIDNDDAHRLMLHNLSVLEYMNGEEPWHNVHPAVRNLQKLQELLPHL